MQLQIAEKAKSLSAIVVADDVLDSRSRLDFDGTHTNAHHTSTSHTFLLFVVFIHLFTFIVDDDDDIAFNPIQFN